MKVLIIFALLCLALSARAAAVPVESDAVAVEEPKSAPEEAVEVEAPAAEEKLSDAPGVLSEAENEAVEEVAAAALEAKAARRFCPDGWFSYQSKCYMFVNTPRSWFQAEEHCNELGASLASAGSSPEYRYLQQITRTANRATAWIGGFYLQGNWMWIDRSGMYYTNWYSQSTATSNSCMYLQSAVGQGWRNCGCGGQLPFICVHNYRC
ncbi:ladderlectin-like [Coregonus clupeaformis]|uniref:ladderlectin-like n=1 Tax=Coregonus clupeaformis TaxID=59861 RepID=UPI001BDFA076|nr:ladderlectin-like [Coregonus clupeaformis]